MADKRANNSIRTRLLVCMIVFTALTVCSLWICQNYFLETIYRNNKLREINAAAAEIINASDSDELEATVEKVAKKYSVCVTIAADKKTFQTISADVTGDCIIHRLDPRALTEIYNEAIKNDGGLLYLSENGDKDGAKTRIILAAKAEHKNDTAFILLNSVIIPVGATVDTMNTVLIFITVIMILLSLVLTFILSGIITRPLTEITKGANALAVGDYGHEFKGGGCREIAQLADTLNYAKDELQKTDRLQKELIANISHDIRTPLTMISGYSQIMRDIPAENTPENLQIIIDETERLSSLVTDVLDLSKLQAGTKKMAKEPLELVGLAEQALEHFYNIPSKCEISLNCTDNVTIKGDKSGVLQVIYNLVNNAVNHTPQGGKVTVDVCRIGDYARLSVADTGEGIPTEMLKDIWQRYYKSDSVTRQNTGSGLGLSIVKEIMLRHDGYYGVSSTVGAGSLFWVDFPISDTPTEENDI